MTTDTDRFKFGENWKRFLEVLNEDRIAEAEHSLRKHLGCEDLSGKTFLDIGSGSGVFSLAARRLGARVHSFDYDKQSVECTQELKNRFYAEDTDWTIEQGSVLDRNYMTQLGKFDVCYSWGVLHHTGSMWQALYNAHDAVKKDGLMYIAIYNDEGIISAIWKIVKKTYCHSRLGKVAMTTIFYPAFFFGGLLIDILKLRNPTKRYSEHRKYRGMSLIHDWKDWLGGYPYQVASTDEIISFFENLGHQSLVTEPTGHGFGNNQFVFRRGADSEKPQASVANC
jgi:2-polyprenyl-3-methyl-5-hydroxy-6-metoxy-1,4-benzoquinol methylase